MPAMITHRSVVEPADCDFLGHMNVSRYFAACSDGVFAIQSDMGLTASDMRAGRRLSFAVVHAESDFRAELSAGDTIRLETTITAIGRKSMTFRHRLFRCEDETVAFETEFKCVLLNLQGRRAAEIPEDVRKKAAAWSAAGENDWVDAARSGAGHTVRHLRPDTVRSSRETEFATS